MTLTIIAGGSTGAERGALQAAIDLGLAIGGWRCAGDDTPPIFAGSMRETTSVDRGMARRLCVQDSDGTLALSSQVAQLAGVVAFVDRTAEAQGKPFMSCTLGQRSDAWRSQILGWMNENDVEWLYVTGPAEDDEPGITVAARAFVKWLFEGVALDEIGKFIDIVKVLEGAVDSDQPLRQPVPPLSKRTHWIHDPDFDATACGLEVGQRSTDLARVDCPECRSFEPLYRPDLAAMQSQLIDHGVVAKYEMIDGKPTQTFAAGQTPPRTDSLVELWSSEFTEAAEAADRKERCVDTHGYGCARPECGRSAVNPEDVVGLADFSPPDRRRPARMSEKNCDHFWVRYTLDDRAGRRGGEHGTDDQGRPYRDVPMQPAQAFAYAQSIGSDFRTRVVRANCAACSKEIPLP